MQCVIGNSSSAIRDCSYLGTPAVNVGTRQNSRLRGLNVIDVKNNVNDIYNALKKQLNRKKFKSSKIYGDGNAAKKIIKILKRIDDFNIQKKITY